MIARVTTFGRMLFALTAFVLLLPFFHTANAQAPDLGEEFIIFVEGTNVLLPSFDGTAVTDPMDPNNTVARFQHGGWAAPGFRWDSEVGADMSSMVGATVADGGASLFLKLLVDPSMAGQTGCGTTTFDCLAITLFDKVLGTEVTDNREGRLKWFIPDDLRDGNWHSIEIPLPPSTGAAQDSAQAGKNVDGTALATPLSGLAMNWEYVGGWSGYGWGGTAGTPQGAADPNWQEFEWDAVRGITIHFDWNGEGSDVLMDDVYIGSSSTDLGSAVSAPAAMSGVTFGTNAASNVVSWAHNPDFGGYNVYLDEAAITQARIDASDVSIFATVPFNAADFSVTHDFQIPHGSLLPLDIYYAVASTNLFGVANSDVSNSSGVVSNTEMSEQAYIIEIDDANADAIFNAVASETVSDDAFPAKTIPFMVDSSHWSASEGALPDNNTDVSGTFKVGFNRSFNELYIYGECTDDVLGLQPGTTADNIGGTGWGFDSVELGWGAYDVRNASGSLLAGAPQQSFQREATPDYQMRISWLGDEAALDPGNTSTFITTGTGETGEGESVGGRTVMALLEDGAGANIGYKFLTVYNFADFRFSGNATDVPFTPPSVDDLALVPFNIAINDNDNAASTAADRERQVQWSTKPTANNAWWNTPSQWMTVAMVGTSVTATANEEEVLPGEFALQQNYPNPFNPSTSIAFTLPQSENVTLSVYNVLGQKVATLISGQTMNVGTHTVQFDASSLASGMYLYRLDAGSSYSKTHTMMLMK